MYFCIIVVIQLKAFRSGCWVLRHWRVTVCLHGSSPSFTPTPRWQWENNHILLKQCVRLWCGWAFGFSYDHKVVSQDIGLEWKTILRKNKKDFLFSYLYQYDIMVWPWFVFWTWQGLFAGHCCVTCCNPVLIRWGGGQVRVGVALAFLEFQIYTVVMVPTVFKILWKCLHPWKVVGVCWNVPVFFISQEKVLRAKFIHSFIRSNTLMLLMTSCHTR